MNKAGDDWLPASLGLYHGSLQTVSIHSSFVPVSLRDYICENYESESESTTTFGTSMDRFDLRDRITDLTSSSSSSDSEDVGGAVGGAEPLRRSWHASQQQQQQQQQQMLRRFDSDSSVGNLSLSAP